MWFAAWGRRQAVIDRPTSSPKAVSKRLDRAGRHRDAPTRATSNCKALPTQNCSAISTPSPNTSGTTAMRPTFIFPLRGARSAPCRCCGSDEPTVIMPASATLSASIAILVNDRSRRPRLTRFSERARNDNARNWNRRLLIAFVARQGDRAQQPLQVRNRTEPNHDAPAEQTDPSDEQRGVLWTTGTSR